MKTLLWAILLLAPTAGVMAQTPAPKSPTTEIQAPPEGKNWRQMSSTDYINLHLPPLHTLMENARERSPQTSMFAAKTEYEERELKNVRRDWLNYFKINSTVSYGTTDASSQILYDNAQLPMVQNVTGTTQRWWNVGASFSMPIGEIFTRRNKIKQQRTRIESSQGETEDWYDAICLKIIDAYTRAEQNLGILNISSQEMITAKAQYAAAESDFINSKIDARSLHVQKNMEASAIREYEKTRGELTRALLELEVLTRTPIISRPEEILAH